MATTDTRVITGASLVDDAATGLLSIAADALRVMLETPRSDNTRRAYESDLLDFMRHLSEPDLSPAAVELIVSMDAQRLTVTLRGYVTDLRKRGLAETTVKRRLNSVKKLVDTARLLGAPCPDPKHLVKAERTVDYRDTRGPELSEIARILDSIDKTSIKGLRDYALLMILTTNGLRRGEPLGCDIRDFDRRTGRLRIVGKGRAQAEWITLLPETCAALVSYLNERKDLSLSAPLFATSDRRDKTENRLTGRGFYDVVRTYGLRELERSLNPHAFRHTGITEALEATNGDIPLVQDFSRHARPETVMVYRHSTRDGQGEVTRLLGDRLRDVRAKTE